MFVRASVGGSSSQAALIKDSTETGLLRFMRSVASTTRCFGLPSGTDVPSTAICSGPSNPNTGLVARHRLVTLPVSEQVRHL